MTDLEKAKALIEQEKKAKLEKIASELSVILEKNECELIVVNELRDNQILSAIQIKLKE